MISWSIWDLYGRRHRYLTIVSFSFVIFWCSYHFWHLTQIFWMNHYQDKDLPTRRIQSWQPVYCIHDRNEEVSPLFLTHCVLHMFSTVIEYIPFAYDICWLLKIPQNINSFSFETNFIKSSMAMIILCSCVCCNNNQRQYAHHWQWNNSAHHYT